MTLPRGRIVTLSPYEARQTLPVRIHTGDSLDFTFNFVRLLRLDETPAELLSAASAAGRGVDVTNVTFDGRYLSLTVSGARLTGQALISIAVSTDQGRTISRSLIVNTVYEELAIEPVLFGSNLNAPVIALTDITIDSAAISIAMGATDRALIASFTPRYRLTGDTDWIELATISAAATTYIFSAILDEATEYDFSVVGNTTFATTIDSNVISATTDTPVDLCNLSEFVHLAGSSLWGEVTYDVALGGSVWISTNGGHKARKSTDGGNTWDAGVIIPGLINSFDRYSGIAYGNGTFVAVGGGAGTVSAYSADGVSWALATNGANLRSVVFGNGVFVAVGTNGTIKTSADGHVWTTQASGAGGNLRKVDYVGGVFMCCGYRTSPGFACIVKRSTDNGATWTEVFTSGTWNDAISIAASDAMWVVLSDSAHGTTDNFRSSIDGGNTWTARNTAITLSDLTSDGCWVYLVGNPGAIYSLANPAVPALQFAFDDHSYTPYGKRIPGVGAVFWAGQLNTYTHP